MYENGSGVPSDIVTAYALYELARANGYSRGDENLARVSGAMTPQQINAAQTLSHELGQQGQLLPVLDRFAPRAAAAATPNS
jgi:hypothetical protein